MAPRHLGQDHQELGLTLLMRIVTSLLIPTTLRGQVALRRRRLVGTAPFRRRVVSLRAPTIAIPVIAITKDVPETPTDDPVVPTILGSDPLIVPPFGLWRRRLIDASNFFVPRRLSDHG